MSQHPVTTVKVALPFAGFYESIHRAAIDAEEDSQRESAIDSGAVSPRFSTQACHEAYASSYGRYLLSELGLNPSPTSDFQLVSPKEYNFATDSIYIDVDLKSLITLVNKLDPQTFGDLVRENHTPNRFSTSNISANYVDWLRTDAAKWSAAQWQTALECAIAEEHGENWEDSWLLDTLRANGNIHVAVMNAEIKDTFAPSPGM